MKRLAMAVVLSIVGCGNADKADNTRKNERDRDSASKTPMDQSEKKEDIAITAAIRKGVMDEDDLSTTAKNVKIITADGVVTLRGPVKSDAEKSTIESLAKGTDGVKSVDNQLEVAAQ
jgi:osmotically-inducible protein OsmY